MFSLQQQSLDGGVSPNLKFTCSGCSEFVELVRIDSSGNFFIGKTSVGNLTASPPQTQGAPTYMFQYIPVGTPIEVITSDNVAETIPVYAEKQTATCPDCKGTKVYVGLLKTEPCVKCEGKGVI
jgi:hypothetical protein